MEKTTNITFNLEDGTEAVLEVLEETKINGINYLLVIDAVDDENDILWVSVSHIMIIAVISARVGYAVALK